MVFDHMQARRAASALLPACAALSCATLRALPRAPPLPPRPATAPQRRSSLSHSNQPWQAARIQADVVTCCSLINALERGGQWQLAEKLFLQMCTAQVFGRCWRAVGWQ